MSINNNIFELAESYLAGTLPQVESAAIESRLLTDALFASEFQECTSMLRSMEASGKEKRFRAMLRDIHTAQSEKQTTKKPKLIQLPAHFWRTAAVAATVAILTSTITIWSLKPSISKRDSQYNTISREVGNIKKVQAQQQAQQKQLIDIISKNSKATPPPSDVTYTGTGFALTNDGYFVTSNHVIHHEGKGDFDSVYIQNHEGQYYKAYLVAYNAEADIAIMKVEKKGFRFGKGEVPYTFAASKAGLGTRIFTLGYPEDEKYDEGYISARNGYDGDHGQYTLELPVGHGQSGSPVVDERGNVLGILTAIGGEEEANTYAVSSKALIGLLNNLPDGKSIRLPKGNKLNHLSREQQIAKMESYTFSVKVYKK